MIAVEKSELSTGAKASVSMSTRAGQPALFKALGFGSADEVSKLVIVEIVCALPGACFSMY